MKLDDLLSADTVRHAGDLDPDLIAALNAHGFVTVNYTLFQKGSNNFVGVITAHYANGQGHTWIGSGNDPNEAEMNAIDALSKWMINQMTPNAAP